MSPNVAAMVFTLELEINPKFVDDRSAPWVGVNFEIESKNILIENGDKV